MNLREIKNYPQWHFPLYVIPPLHTFTNHYSVLHKNDLLLLNVYSISLSTYKFYKKLKTL